MTQYSRTKILTLTCLLISVGSPLVACTDYWNSVKTARELFRPEWFSAEWVEEVQLSDGRVIEITQQRKYEKSYAGDGSGKSTIVRDAWIRFRLPETNNREVEWHENLIGMRFDVVEGKPFIVAYPPTYQEAIKYGKPKPSYLGYVYVNNRWSRVSFSEIPESQYDLNLVADRILPNGMTRLSLSEKNTDKFNADPDIGRCYKRVNSTQRCSW